jgi:hypothetical protein
MGKKHTPPKRSPLYDAQMSLQKAGAEITRLEQELADTTSDYHRWHDAYLRLKYPGIGERVAGTVACKACDGSGVTTPDASAESRRGENT